MSKLAARRAEGVDDIGRRSDRAAWASPPGLACQSAERIDDARQRRFVGERLVAEQNVDDAHEQVVGLRLGVTRKIQVDLGTECWIGHGFVKQRCEGHLVERRFVMGPHAFGVLSAKRSIADAARV